MGKTIQMGWLLLRSVSAVRGDLLHWARVQQEFTMRWVHDQGGPSPAFQSEIENGIKHVVSPTMLAPWITVLDVTEDFAQGKFAQYHQNPAACFGLLKEIGSLVAKREGERSDWTQLTEQDRVRQVLRAVIQHSNMSAVVLAWILELQVATLRDLVEGQQPILRVHMESVAALTMLPERFLTHGQLTQPDEFADYKAVVQRAAELGVSAKSLLRMLQLHGRHVTVKQWKRPG